MDKEEENSTGDFPSFTNKEVVVVNYIFNLLAKLGYTYPIHPAVVHLTMGLILGGFIFVFVAIVFNHPTLFTTAYHCAILALLGVIPAALFGLLDWQNTFNGQWLAPIKIKMILTGIIVILLFIIFRIGKDTQSPSKLLILHGLTLLAAIAMGYNGGKLLFG